MQTIQNSKQITKTELRQNMKAQTIDTVQPQSIFKPTLTVTYMNIYNSNFILTAQE